MAKAAQAASRGSLPIELRDAARGVCPEEQGKKSLDCWHKLDKPGPKVKNEKNSTRCSVLLLPVRETSLEGQLNHNPLAVLVLLREVHSLPRECDSEAGYLLGELVLSKDVPELCLEGAEVGFADGTNHVHKQIDSRSL